MVSGVVRGGNGQDAGRGVQDVVDVHVRPQGAVHQGGLPVVPGAPVDGCGGEGPRPAFPGRVCSVITGRSQHGYREIPDAFHSHPYVVCAGVGSNGGPSQLDCCGHRGAGAAEGVQHGGRHGRCVVAALRGPGRQHSFRFLGVLVGDKRGLLLLAPVVRDCGPGPLGPAFGACPLLAGSGQDAGFGQSLRKAGVVLVLALVDANGPDGPEVDCVGLVGEYPGASATIVLVGALGGLVAAVAALGVGPWAGRGLDRLAVVEISGPFRQEIDLLVGAPGTVGSSLRLGVQLFPDDLRADVPSVLLECQHDPGGHQHQGLALGVLP